MASPNQVITTLADRGVALTRLPGDRLHISGRSKLSEAERATLRTHKAAILRALPPPEPVTRTRPEKIHPATACGIPLKALLHEAHESDYPDLESFETLQAFAQSCLWSCTLTVESTPAPTPPSDSGLMLEPPFARGTIR